MSVQRVLALSSSRVGNGGYLEAAVPVIKDFLGDKINNVAFIPFAAADNDYDNYLAKVQDGLSSLRYNISLVLTNNAKAVIEEADAIMVGGGNTFKLLHHLYDNNVMSIIKQKVDAGVPYVGWSAGANITGLTIGTTNDMPIIEPQSFKAFGFFPFQINPHYLNLKAAGHNGETRDERLTEYLKVNRQATIIGLPEGTALLKEGNKLTLAGAVEAVMFQLSENKKDVVKSAIEPGSDLSTLL